MKPEQHKTKEYRKHTGALLSFRQASEEGNGTVSGHVAVFDKKSDLIWGFREIVKPGAFAESLLNDDVRALVDHEPSKIIGRNKAGTLRMKEDETGLFVEIDLPNTTAANDLRESMSRGDVTGGSFGFRIEDDEWKITREEELHIIRKASLFDVSIVTYPAYPDTGLSVRSADAFAGAKSAFEEAEKALQERRCAESLKQFEMRLEIVEAEL